MTKEEKLQLKVLLQKFVIKYSNKINKMVYSAIVRIYYLVEEED